VDVFSTVPRDFLRRAAIAAARELGLFAALPCAPEELAGRLGVAPRRLDKLVTALGHARVLRLDLKIDLNTGTRLVLDVEPEAQAGAAEPDAQDAGAWSRIAQAVREDRPVAGRAEEHAGPFHDHLWTLGAAAAPELWRTIDRLGDRDRAGATLLDVGGGAGAYSAAWIASRPDRRATLVDRGEIVALAAGRLPEQVTLIAGDAATLALEARFDVVLMCNLLHLYGPPACAHLIARAAAALAPGGRLIVKDLDPATDEGVWFALNMALYTEGGDVHAPEQIAAWLTAAGLGAARTDRIAAAPSSLLVHGGAP